MIGVRVTAQEAVFFAQSAEQKADGTGLTDVGRQKAEALARELEDAGIEVIYSFDRPTVVQTAEPTAKALNIAIKKIAGKPAAIDDWINRLPTEHNEQRVLVVSGAGGFDTGSGERILKGLGLPEVEILTGRTDQLFVFVPRGSEEPLVIKMRW